MADAESENAFRWHQTKMLRADFLREQLAVSLKRESVRNLYRRPKFVFGPALTVSVERKTTWPENGSCCNM